MSWPPVRTSKLTLEWTDDDSAWVIALDAPPSDPVKVGTLGWNGSQWFFWRLTQDGEVIMDGGYFIDVDPEQDDAFRKEAFEIARLDESIRTVRELELQGRRTMFRDDSRDLASIGARVEARRWLTVLGDGDPFARRHLGSSDPCPTTGRPLRDCSCEDCEGDRLAILTSNAAGVTRREIAQTYGISILKVDEILRDGGVQT